MRSAISQTRGLVAVVTAWSIGCSSSSSPNEPGDQPMPDAAPAVDSAIAGGAARGPSLGIDSISLTGANPTFKSLGSRGLNAQLASAIANGMLVLAIELGDLGDPAGQNDPAVSLTLHDALDVDGMPANNFSAADPDDFVAANPAQPRGTFTGSITAGKLQAKAATPFALAGLTLVDATIAGTFVATGAAIGELTNATLRGPTTAAALGGTAVSGLPCPGQTMLDVLVRGCSIVPGSQPDADRDGDGLERFADTDDDGRIDRCTDGGGAIFNGTDCWSRPQFVDGYVVEMGIHATRVLLFDPR